MKSILMTALMALVLCACSTNALSGQADCNSDIAQITQVRGDCSRTIDKLEKAEQQRIVVQTSDIVPFTTVDYTLTVDTGTVEIKFVDAQGNTKTAQASPGSPATASLTVQLDGLNQIKFDLTPVGGPAEGVTYQLNFVCDCLP